MTPAQLADLTGQPLAIVGKTGSGKTYTAKGLVERLLAAGRRVCVLDPTGVWWGLKASQDGKRPGFPIAVFGGMHADVPIAEGSGAALAKIIASKNLPAIIDLSEMLIGQRHNFVTDFAEAIYRDNRLPLHLVIDEADEFAPQNPMPETKRMLHHVDRIVRRGRVRGFRVILITQRPAVLHKNVLTQANALIAMRLTAPQDRAALQAWVEGNADAVKAKEVIGSLAGLQRGNGWVWAPEAGILERTQFPPITTFDSSRTPEDDEQIVEPTNLAAVDLSEVQASLKAVEPTEPEGEKQLRAELTKQRKRVLELEAEAAAREPEPAAPAVTGALRAELAQVTRQRDALELVLNSWHTRARKIAQSLLEHTGDVALGTKDAEKLGAAAARNLVRQEFEAPQQPQREESPTHAQRQREAPTARPAPARVTEGVSGPQQRILDSLAWWIAFGVAAPTRVQVAMVARYSPNGSAFTNPLSGLRTAGSVEYPADGAVCLTKAGIGIANAPVTPPSRKALHAMVREILSGPQWRILEPLVECYPASMPRDQLAAAANYSPDGSAFTNPLSSLRTLGLVAYPAKGDVVAMPILFPKGRGNG